MNFNRVPRPVPRYPRIRFAEPLRYATALSGGNLRMINGRNLAMSLFAKIWKTAAVTEVVG